MVRVDEGWTVILIEEVLKEVDKSIKTLLGLLEALARGCILVTSPTTTRLCRKDGLCLDLCIGVGSLLCPPGIVESNWVVYEPFWCYGVKIGGKCRLIASKNLALPTVPQAKLESIESYSSLHDVIDTIGLGERALILLANSNLVDVEPQKGCCGVLGTLNPLHPVGVIGRTKWRTCCDKVFEPVGKGHTLLPILSVGGKTIAWSFNGLGEAVVLGYNPQEVDEPLRLAYLLGLLYSCGEPLG